MRALRFAKLRQPEEKRAGDEDNTVFVKNRYYCSTCDLEWVEVADCACDDRCPSCNTAISPGETWEVEVHLAYP
jgi:hypothetical protein